MAHINTRVIQIDPVNPDTTAIKEAAQFIKNGRLVVFPTETVYGIGADAFNATACQNIFRVKGRPSDNPLIVHVASFRMASELADIPERYAKQLERAWPSPITIIAKAKRRMPDSVTAGLETLALRMPAHPVALALIKESGVPIAAPSANPSKKPTSTNASHAIKYFSGKVDCIIDSGAAFFGIESTIIDLTTFTLLRPGPFTSDEIVQVFGKMPKINSVSKGTRTAANAISPGTKYQHYAPDTPLFMFSGKTGALIDTLLEIEEPPPFVFIGSNESCAAVSKELGCSTIALGSASNLYDVAKNLYDGLIALDSLGVSFAVTEEFDESGIGLAIMNRLRKASSNEVFSTARQFSTLLAKMRKDAGSDVGT